MPITLVRHTRVVMPGGLCYGRTDVPLANTFLSEAAKVRARVGPLPPIVFTSPSERCRRLANALGANQVQVDERLQELDFGAWEDRLWDDLPRADVDAWAENFVKTPTPGGESFCELIQRVDSFRTQFSATDAVVITHAGVIRAWLCLKESLPPDRAFRRAVQYGCVIRI